MPAARSLSDQYDEDDDEQSANSSEERYMLKVLQVTLKFLDEPTCHTVREGKDRLNALKAAGKYTWEYIDEAIEDAMEEISVKGLYK